MRGINDDHVNTGSQQGLSALFHVRPYADGSTRPEPAQTVLTCIGIFLDFFDVLDGNEPC